MHNVIEFFVCWQIRDVEEEKNVMIKWTKKINGFHVHRMRLYIWHRTLMTRFTYSCLRLVMSLNIVRDSIIHTVLVRFGWSRVNNRNLRQFVTSVYMKFGTTCGEKFLCLGQFVSNIFSDYQLKYMVTSAKYDEMKRVIKPYQYHITSWNEYDLRATVTCWKNIKDWCSHIQLLGTSRLLYVAYGECAC